MNSEGKADSQMETSSASDTGVDFLPKDPITSSPVRNGLSETAENDEAQELNGQKSPSSRTGSLKDKKEAPGAETALEPPSKNSVDKESKSKTGDNKDDSADNDNNRPYLENGKSSDSSGDEAAAQPNGPKSTLGGSPSAEMSMNDTIDLVLDESTNDAPPDDRQSGGESAEDGDSSPPPDPSPTENSEGRNGRKVGANNSSEELSDVEFLDEVPKQIQNRLETSSSATTPLTADSFRQRFVDLVEKIVSKEDGTGGERLEQKVTDLLGKYVQQESVISPLGVRKIVEGEEFKSPSGVFFPPSQVVQLMSWYEPEEQLRSIIDRMFGADAASPESLSERKHKQEFRMFYPAPSISRALYDIGLQLAQESTYSDIVSMKNLPSEMPRKPDTISKVVAQVKPYLEMLKTQTGPYKIKMDRCRKCSFRTESELVMDEHLRYPHFREKTGLYTCVHCEEENFRTRKKENISEHYSDIHGIEPLFETPLAKYPCPICDQDFGFKGVLLQHLKVCRRSMKSRYILAGSEDDRLTANKWLWPKPADVPSSGVTTGVRVFQTGNNQQGVQYIQAPGIQGGSTSRLQVNLQGRGNTVLRVPPGMQLQQQSFRRQPNILPKNSGDVMSFQQRQQLVLQQNRITPGSTILGRNAMGDLCEICDQALVSRDKYLEHLQQYHHRIPNKTRMDFMGGAPLACSRCKDRFWTYEGLERHLVMTHGLVTSDLLQKAQNKLDSGRCTFCNKQYAFNLLQHLVVDHKRKLCSAEILYSCDVCTYQCTSYTDLEKHLNLEHGNQNQRIKRPMLDSLTGSSATKSMRLTPKVVPPQLRLANQMGQRRFVNLPGQKGNDRIPPQLEPAKKPTKVRYTCTPCNLKFVAYSEVIAHWQEKHLEKKKPHTCRVDDCTECKESFEKQGIQVDWEMPQVDLEGLPPKSDVICLD